ncbi:hypothetical protein B4N89_41455 [Embleya scabrispora]|uniref:Uncharacterized protein n=1 Tax=Embleya scabrispora TaxID=159449 RepID=A0A1T3NL34_9ACTN|nr:hypothetical protein B4N89_41455 [Embleya scabrispora]
MPRAGRRYRSPQHRIRASYGCLLGVRVGEATRRTSGRSLLTLRSRLRTSGAARRRPLPERSGAGILNAAGTIRQCPRTTDGVTRGHAPPASGPRPAAPGPIDAARAAGVSTSTASPASGGSGRVSETTRERGQGAAREPGHRTDTAAGSPTVRTQSIRGRAHRVGQGGDGVGCRGEFGGGAAFEVTGEDREHGGDAHAVVVAPAEQVDDAVGARPVREREPTAGCRRRCARAAGRTGRRRAGRRGGGVRDRAAARERRRRTRPPRNVTRPSFCRHRAVSRTRSNGYRAAPSGGGALRADPGTVAGGKSIGALSTAGKLAHSARALIFSPGGGEPAAA